MLEYEIHGVVTEDTEARVCYDLAAGDGRQGVWEEI